MAAVVILIGGANVTADVVYSRTDFTSIADGGVGTCTVTIDDKAHAYTEANFVPRSSLELFIDGVRQWDGWLFTVNRSWPLPADDTSTPSDVPRFWVLSGQDRNLLFTKRILFRQNDPIDDRGLKDWPKGTTDKQALEYTIDHYADMSDDGLTYRIRQVASPSPYEIFTLGYVSAPLGTAFEECSQMTGAMYFVDPDRVMTYIDDMTVTAPAVLSDEPSGSQVGYREFDVALDYSNAANDALVWGAGKGSSDAVFARYTDGGSVNGHGLWQWGDEFIGAWKAATAFRRAKTYVEGSSSHRRGHSDPVPVVTCTIFEPASGRAKSWTSERSSSDGRRTYPSHRYG